MRGRELKVANISIKGFKPLYNRVPARDEQGNHLSDFMVLIKGLRDWPGDRKAGAIARVHGVLSAYPEVVFADLNLRLNLLWVSVRPRYGVISEIAAELHDFIPEAKLVGSYYG